MSGVSTAAIEPLAVRAAAPRHLPALPAASGLHWRALTKADVPEWYALTSVVDDVDDALERRTQAELTQMFEGAWRSPESDSVAGFDADGRIRAYVWSDFRSVTEGTHAPVIFGSVHPGYRASGVGRALVWWAEARARQQLAGVDVELPARIRFYVDEYHAAARRLAERCGFVPRRWYVGMRRDLSVPLPDVPMPDGVTIVPYSDELREQVRVTHNESFARDHWGSSPFDPEAWSLNVVGGEAFRPDWSFVALESETNNVAGYLLSGAYTQDWEPQGYTEGWTDLVGVRREWRRRGVAARLLVSAMGAYASSGMDYAGLDVDTDNPTDASGVYTALGYERQPGAVLLTKEI